MKKKLLVIMTMIALLVMAGCGGNTTAEDQTAAEDQTVEETADVQDDAEAAQESEEEDIDLGEVADKADQISEKEAKAIVLKHAGLKEDDVEFIKCKKDKDDGVWIYEIEFISGDKEYDYDVRMSDGKIMEYDVDDADDD